VAIQTGEEEVVNKRRPKLVKIVALLSTCFTETASADQNACIADNDATARRQAEQKVLLLERLVGETDPVQRVFESGQAEAVAAITAAREAVVQARRDLDAGCNIVATEAAIAGLNRASTAFKLARNQPSAGESDYLALHRRTSSFLAVLESQPIETQGIGAGDIVGMQRQLARAEELAVEGDYKQASKLLLPVIDRLERRLIAIFDQQTVYYEREFSGPEDEYNYLVEQYRGYQLLLDQITTERQLPFNTRAGYNQARQDAAGLDDAAAQLAAVGDLQAALKTMTNALAKCEQALRLSGIRY